MSRISLYLLLFLSVHMACRKKNTVLISPNTPSEVPANPSPQKKVCLITADGYQIPYSDFSKWNKFACNQQNYLNESLWFLANSAAPCSNLVSHAQTGFCLGENRGIVLSTELNSNFPERHSGKYLIAPQLFVSSETAQNRKITLGLPYTATPIAFSLHYKYKPGTTFNDNNGFVQNGVQDSMDAIAILEHREPETNKVKRLAVAWFRSGEKQENCQKLQIPFVYAHQNQAPQSLKNYQRKVLKYAVDGDSNKNSQTQNEANWGDSATLKPTHLVVLFTSSHRGDEYAGAAGSTLTINDFQLLYNKCK